MSKPTHIHYCKVCKFLGSIMDSGRQYDLYFCSLGHPSILARYGSNSFDYSSGIRFGIIDGYPMMREALKLALRNKEYKELIDVRVMTYEHEVHKKMYLDIVANLN